MKLKRPMLLGALVSVCCVIAVFYCKTAIFAAIIFLCGALAFNIFKLKNFKITVVLFCVGIIIISLGFSLIKIETAENLSGQTVSEDFVITDFPYYNGDSFVADAVCLSSNSLKKGDKIRLYYDGASLDAGDKIGATIKTSHIKKESSKQSLYSENIYMSGSVKSFSLVKTNDYWLCFLPTLRRNIKNILNTAPTTYKSKAVASAITVGDKGQFDNEFESLVKAAGVSHIFVVSGMHLVILLGGLLNTLGCLFYNKYFYILFSLCGVLLFSVICGFSMSIMRAAVMFIVLAAAPLFLRDNDPLNSIGTAVLLISSVSPYTLFSVAFQLSVLSTLGILLLTDYISEKIIALLRVKKVFLKSIINSVAVTISATVMTAPVCIYHFGYLSTVSVITNLLITYVVTYMLFFNAIGIIIGLIFESGFLSNAFLYIAGVLSEYTVKVIEDFGSLNFSTVRLPKWTVFAFIIIALAVILLKMIDKKKDYIMSRRI